jgi:peptidoglycan/LPS O-acetylase OafA/YrhL
MREWGSVGVTLFFVLSGFLITALLLQEKRDTGRIKLSDFYRRRALRLLPAVVAVSLSVAVGLLVLGEPERALAEGLAPLTYVVNWLRILGLDLEQMSHTWSLAVEEQFYLVWPMAFIGIMALRMRPVVGLLVAAGGLCIWRLLLVLEGASRSRVFLGTDTNADALLVGCALAFGLSHSGRRAPRFAPEIGLALFLMALGAGALGEAGVATIGLTAAALSGGLLVWWLATTERSILDWRPLVGLGVISYGVYLWHGPIIRSLPDVAPPLVVGPLVVLVAIASYHWIERPFLMRRHGRSGRLLPAA